MDESDCRSMCGTSPEKAANVCPHEVPPAVLLLMPLEHTLDFQLYSA